jgi:hypothetical protein
MGDNGLQLRREGFILGRYVGQNVVGEQGPNRDVRCRPEVDVGAQCVHAGGVEVGPRFDQCDPALQYSSGVGVHVAEVINRHWQQKAAMDHQWAYPRTPARFRLNESSKRDITTLTGQFYNSRRPATGQRA